MKQIHLPPLGLGMAALALCPEDEARAAVELALSSGITYFDTAALYGGGQAEVRLGQALKGVGDDVMVSTKLGRYREYGALPPRDTGVADIWDYSAGTTRVSFERSCERLGRERLYVVFLHDIEANPEQAFSEALPVLRELQAEGRIGLIGAGCNTVAGSLAVIDAKAADALLVAGRWTLMDRTAGNKLLDHAVSNACQVISGGVLNSGFLFNPDKPGATFDYRPATETERQAAYDLQKVAERFSVPLIAAALQFPKRDQRVRTTLLGVSGRAQMESTLRYMQLSIPDAFWESIHKMGLHS